jgi:hypothetical protein
MTSLGQFFPKFWDIFLELTIIYCIFAAVLNNIIHFIKRKNYEKNDDFGRYDGCKSDGKCTVVGYTESGSEPHQSGWRCQQ